MITGCAHGAALVLLPALAKQRGFMSLICVCVCVYFFSLDSSCFVVIQSYGHPGSDYSLSAICVVFCLPAGLFTVLKHV